jgi:hypothetical protein
LVASETLALHFSGIGCPNFVDAGLDTMHLSLGMKTLNFQIVPLATEVADAARRAAAAGAPDHAIITADSPTGYPCRHCLHWAQPGERVILFPYGAIPPGYPYSEIGPIFVHATPCERYSATNEFPAAFRNGRVMRAYNSAFNMIDAEIVNGSEPEAVVEKLMKNPETAFVDARSVTRGCYTFRIHRA